MALLTKWLGTDLWGAIQTKNDNLVDAVNELVGGTTGQRLVKSSSTDFDVEYANPENIAKYTGSAFALNSLIVGNTINFSTTQSTYVGNANQLVKIYSLSNPNKYIIGKLENSTTSTILVCSIQFNSDIADTTSISDWVIVPYNYNLSVFNSDLQTSFIANELFSVLTLTNCTLNQYNVNTFKEANKVTINGFVDLTLTGSSPRVNFSLTDKYAILNGNTYDFIFNSSAKLNVSGTQTSVTAICDNVSVGSSSENLLAFRTNNTVASGNSLRFTFSFSYIAKNYSV
jgi:hypothetical protein